jgi:hypothetical protein
MFKRKVLLINGTYGVVIATYDVEDSGTIIPDEAIESDTLMSGDELMEDGTIVKYITPAIQPQPKQLTPDDLTIQNHAMLTYLMYGDNPNPQ